MAANNNVLVLRNFDLPKAPGAHYRLVCMSGDRKGEVYYLRGNRVVLGRSDTCDIQVFDSKSSREHAEVVRVGASFVITDMKSQNGLIVNDQKVTQKELKENDIIIIGKTVYKFGRVEVKDNSAEIRQINEKLSPERGAKPDEKVKKKNLMVVILALALMYMFLTNEEAADNREKKEYLGDSRRSNITDEFMKEEKRKEERKNKEIIRVIDSTLHEGLRELREENYYRALEKFRDVLELDKNNNRAKRYEKITLNFLDKKIENMFLKARRDMDALRFKTASITYCDIMRVLQMDKEDARFKDAEANVRFIEEKMGLEKNEIECL